MTFLMLLSVGFYQGQKTQWVRKHKPPGTHSAWGSWAGCWKIELRGLGNELGFPSPYKPTTLAEGPFKAASTLYPTCRAPSAAPRLAFPPDGHWHPHAGGPRAQAGCECPQGSSKRSFGGWIKLDGWRQIS